ncbi:mechanosensitive ion channel family protein [Pusillimonas sp. CC-YST705]|uniref:Small-conductance mechanosensitive channel n=1 Tax=Mesopusillimonas faecipullorum TaxID=2755040 RepID=A0ABS8CEM8_9BURK|nr:mechanosensitive ion channel family protein [Mesopusillimonas faecipullorum]MCB5364500.1 mechanosensitive ion channel family protein [Mesopusillimonas faecipullorum]
MIDWLIWLPYIERLALDLLVAAMIMLGGWVASHIVARMVRRVAQRSQALDPTVLPMALSVAVWAIRIVAIVAALARLGVQTTSIIAMLGAAGLAVGLALQNTLQNIAAGIMLLVLRPLRTGESISIVGKADGTVEEVGLFLCKLRQADGTSITLPNSLVWGNPIINLSRNGTRRAEVRVVVMYQEDLKAGLNALLTLAQRQPNALENPAPDAWVVEHRLDTSVLGLRVWALSANYGALLNELQRDAPQALCEAGLRLPRSEPPASA